MVNRRKLALWWNGTNGVAICQGMHTPIDRKPRVLDLDIEAIDYADGDGGKRWVRERGGDQAGRELTTAEQDYIAAALKRMKTIGVDAIC